MILSAGVGSGHNSAAAAVEQACSARTDIHEVQVLDVLQVSSALYRDVLAKGYFALVEDLPWLIEWGYGASDPPFRRRGPIDPWTGINALPVTGAIKRFAPTSIVCTHFLPAQLLAALLLRGLIDAKTAIVTTDYDFQGLWNPYRGGAAPPTRARRKRTPDAVDLRRRERRRLRRGSGAADAAYALRFHCHGGVWT